LLFYKKYLVSNTSFTKVNAKNQIQRATWWISGNPNVPKFSVTIEDVLELILAHVVAQVANIDLKEIQPNKDCL